MSESKYYRPYSADPAEAGEAAEDSEDVGLGRESSSDTMIIYTHREVRQPFHKISYFLSLTVVVYGMRMSYSTFTVATLTAKIN